MQTFHLFRHLPRELRERIWFFCLPRRVAILDKPVWDLSYWSDKDIQQQCWMTCRELSRRANSPPLIAFVCHEARQLAFRWGGSERITGVSMFDTWIQRQLDTLLCTWTFNDSAIEGSGDDTLDNFLRDQRHNYPGSPVCLLAEHFFEFHSNASASGNRHAPALWVNRMDNPASISYLLQDSTEILGTDLSFTMDVDVIMETVHIHTSMTDLLASQVFGHIIDEPCQLVDYTDATMLDKFHALFKKNIKNQKRTAQVKLFNAMKSLEFLYQVKRWLIKVEWLLLALKWLHEKRHNPQSSIYKDPTQVFDRPEAINSHLRMGLGRGRINSFKTDHPWVIQETERLPKLKPKVLFAYCLKDCHLQSVADDDRVPGLAAITPFR